MDDEKVAAIKTLQRPLTKRLLKGALGLFGYYRVNIRDFSANSYLLTEMLLKNKPDRLVWTENQIEAYEELRVCLMEKPVLHPPDRSHGYVMQTDASLFAISAVLLQTRRQGEGHSLRISKITTTSVLFQHDREGTFSGNFWTE